MFTICLILLILAFIFFVFDLCCAFLGRTETTADKAFLGMAVLHLPLEVGIIVFLSILLSRL